MDKSVAKNILQKLNAIAKPLEVIPNLAEAFIRVVSSAKEEKMGIMRGDDSADVDEKVEEIKESRLVILLGAGAGDNLLKILKDFSGKIIFVYEPDPRILKRVIIDKDDILKYIKSNNVVFMTKLTLSGESDLISAIFNSMIETSVDIEKAVYVINTIQWKRDPVEYKETWETIKSAIVSTREKRGNSVEDVLWGMGNIGYNGWALLEHSLNDARNPLLTVNDSVILVGAGPSLDMQIPILRNLRDKFTIVCVDAAYRKLVREGVIPDAVAISERVAHKNPAFLSGIDSEIEKKIMLIARPCVYPSVLYKWKGDIAILFGGDKYEHMLGKAIGAFLSPSVTAIGLAASFSVWMGCKKVILSGNDFAMSADGELYSEGAVDLIKDFARVNALAEGVIEIQGTTGAKVKSTPSWRRAKIEMESVFRNGRVSVFNLTSRGALIEGAKAIRSSDLLKTVGESKKINLASSILDNVTDKDDADIRSELESFISQRMKQLSDISDYLKRPLDKDSLEKIMAFCIGDDKTDEFRFIGEESHRLIMECSALNDESSEIRIGEFKRYAERIIGFSGGSIERLSLWRDREDLSHVKNAMITAKIFISGHLGDHEDLFPYVELLEKYGHYWLAREVIKEAMPFSFRRRCLMSSIERIEYLAQILRAWEPGILKDLLLTEMIYAEAAKMYPSNADILESLKKERVSFIMDADSMFAGKVHFSGDFRQYSLITAVRWFKEGDNDLAEALLISIWRGTGMSSSEAAMWLYEIAREKADKESSSYWFEKMVNASLNDPHPRAVELAREYFKKAGEEEQLKIYNRILKKSNA